MSSIDSTIDRQNDLFGLIARAVENLRKLGESKLTRGHVQSRLDSLSANWTKYQDNHEKLCKVRLEVNKQSSYFKDDLYSQCESKFLDAKGTMLDIIDTFHTASTPKETVNEHSVLVSQSSRSKRLPKIDLPHFSGSYSEWAHFRDLFTSMVTTNSDLSCVEKLHYLKMSLTGEPSQLIKNIAISGDNFSRAWELLSARYENRRLHIDAHLTNLFAVHKMNQETSTELKGLLGVVREEIGALETLGCAVNHWDSFLVHHIVRKLDTESLKDWEKSVGGSTEPVPYSELEQFLVSRIHALEAVEGASCRKFGISSFKKSNSSNLKSHSVSTKEFSCSLCKENHYLSSCSVYRAKTPSQRRELVITKGLCFNCLGNHQVRECRTSKRCLKCGKLHHSTLHDASTRVDTSISKGSGAVRNKETIQDSQISDPVATTSQVSSHVAAHEAQTCHIDRTPVLLATALIKVYTSSGEKIQVRALLDQGSESSFITESLAQRLRLPRRHAVIPITTTGAQRMCTTRGDVRVTIESCLDRTFAFDVQAYVLPKVTDLLPSSQVTRQDWSYLFELPLADLDFSTPKRVDMILGADVYAYVLRNGLRRGRPDAPIAQETALGWIVSGRISNFASLQSHCAIQSFRCSIDHELIEVIKRFWEQEEPSYPKPELSQEDKDCEQFFVSTHSRDSTGRYLVRLPLKDSKLDLGDSYTPACRMLSRMEKRFSIKPEFKQSYSDFMQEYISLGHMCRAPEPGNTGQSSGIYYLPHHGVIKESSSTTQLRVVFNGSQKTDRGTSLNDHLLVGPKIQTDLIDVLLRWRRYPIVFATDIEKMYRQILIHPEDWDLQRIVWRSDPLETVQSFHLRTVTYGLSSAPFLAIRTLRQVVEDENERFPLAKDIIYRQTYADDVFSGADTVEECILKINQLTGALSAGGFILKKWIANYDRILEDVPLLHRENSVSRQMKGEHTFRALGLEWQSRLDVFTFIPKEENRNIGNTKRCVLSQISQLFDPLGFLAPVTILAKIFMQELWSLNLDWDTELPEPQSNYWKKFILQFRDVTSLRVPRWMGTSSSSIGIELHGFSDASQDALGAVVYVRVLSDFNNIRVSFVAAKTKVAPLNRVTIPRLELSAAVILVRLVTRIRETLDFHDVPIHLWTDSTVTLAWINSHPSRWKEYVRNRVVEVQELNQARWHHVPGKCNPADLASRGVFPADLGTQQLWWSGPEWLQKPSTQWPSIIPSLDAGIDLEERTKVSANTTIKTEIQVWDLVDRYSTLTQLLRVTVWIQRAISRFKGRKLQQGPLQPFELETARLTWVRITQNAYFNAEIRLLNQHKVIPRGHALLPLLPFVDENGLLRLGGRLKHAFLDHDEKHPMILPRVSKLTTLVIEHYHRKTLHGGTQLMLNSIRRHFWILGGRHPVKMIIHRCVPCTRQRANLSAQVIGQLPSSRVVPSRPFLNSGIDYAGPISLRSFRGRGAKTYKAFIAVFICFVTSAIHLEAVTDYTSDAFIAAYKRFSGRRGICATILSDCGTNLIGADSELRKLFDQASRESEIIANQLANDGTLWKFNPPSSPHFGGKWEAGVKSVKFHLKRIVGDTSLTYEELSTLLVQVEATLNSRPLCPLSDDPTDFQALTPGHFLIGSSLTTVPEPSLISLPQARMSRWQMLRQMLENFWKRWSMEYLQHLQTTTKWQRPQPQINIGSLVLIKDERYPPSKWPLARVIDVHPGADGFIRVVTVKTQTTTLKRPIVKLCLLPVDVPDAKP